MGGYSPGYEGKLEGLKTGLTTDFPLHEHTRKLDYKTLHGDFLVWYGIGFIKGQEYRTKLWEVLPHPEVNSKAEALVWLQGKTTYNFELTKFQQAAEAHLENLSLWDIRTIPSHVYEDSKDFLRKGRLQKALNCVEQYYEDNFHLLSRIAFSTIRTKLDKIRFAKKMRKLSNSTTAINDLTNELHSWLEKYKTRH